MDIQHEDNDVAIVQGEGKENGFARLYVTTVVVVYIGMNI